MLLVSIIGLIGWGSYLEYEVKYWDEKLAALCAADGGKNVGLRVYERVLAPQGYIRPASGAMPSYVFVPWRFKGSTKKEDEPIVTELIELETLHDVSPRVSKFSSRIVRVSDNKVLAEEIGYMRVEGGIPLPTPGDRFVCPGEKLNYAGSSAIYSEVFINHPLKSTLMAPNE